MLSNAVKYRQRINRWRRHHQLSAWRCKALFKLIRDSVGYLPWERNDVSSWKIRIRKPTEQEMLDPDYREGYSIVTVWVTKLNRKKPEVVTINA